MERSLASKGRRTFLQPLITPGNTTLPSYEGNGDACATGMGLGLSTELDHHSTRANSPWAFASFTQLPYTGVKALPISTARSVMDKSIHQLLSEGVFKFTTIIQSCLICFPIPNTFDPSSREGACTVEALKAFVCVCRWPKHNHP